MTRTDIEKRALALSRDDRAALARALLDSLDADRVVVAAAETDAAELEVLGERLAAVMDGSGLGRDTPRRFAGDRPR